MIEYNTTMPDGSVLYDKRDGSDPSAFMATNLPSEVFYNATTNSPNGTLPGPEELFDLTWTDKGFKWTDMNYCGWNMPWPSVSLGPCEFIPNLIVSFLRPTSVL